MFRRLGGGYDFFPLLEWVLKATRCLQSQALAPNSLRELRRAGRLGEFVHVHLQQDACYVSADGGRVCRPLIICDQGVPRVRQEHITKLRSGEVGVEVGRQTLK